MDAAPGVWIPFIVVLVAAIAWCSAMTAVMITLKRDCALLIKMHESPDDFGFGTIALRATHERDQLRLERLIEENTRVMQEVAHYIRWSIEHTTGTKPPPPKPAIMSSGD